MTVIGMFQANKTTNDGNKLSTKPAVRPEVDILGDQFLTNGIL